MLSLLKDVSGCYAAREFVGWYNGLPSMADVGINVIRAASIALQ